jgi:predicted nucleic acid-binding protein
MIVGNLNKKETQQFYDLINKGVILCQWYEKEHVDEKMSDEEWKEFVDKKELAFADACSEALEDIK